jgi:hypothetical protein
VLAIASQLVDARSIVHENGHPSSKHETKTQITHNRDHTNASKNKEEKKIQVLPETKFHADFSNEKKEKREWESRYPHAENRRRKKARLMRRVWQEIQQ